MKISEKLKQLIIKKAVSMNVTIKSRTIEKYSDLKADKETFIGAIIFEMEKK